MAKVVIKLYIKKIKNIFYMGITTENDALKYKGSGVEWTKLVRKYGKHNIETTVLCEEEMIGTKPSDEFQKKCLFYSKLYDIVESKNFANLCQENGIPGRYKAEAKGKKIYSLWERKLRNERPISQVNNNDYNKEHIVVKPYNHLVRKLVDNETPLENAENKSLEEATRSILGSLTPREAKVLRMRFGIGMNTIHTLREIGKIFDVGPNRIREVEAKALRKLRHPSRSEQLKDFLDLE